MSITPMPPAKAKGERFEHGSVLGGKTRSARVSCQWKSTISGLDFENAGTYEKGPPGKSKPKPDEVFGQHMNFVQVLPGVLRVMAQTLRRNTLSDALKLPLEELVAARDDMCGALTISRDFYEATKWIYGNRAFGMRLAAWLSSSAASQRAMRVLGFALLKRSKYPFLSSEQIADLARKAAAAKRDVLRLRAIDETDSRFASLITPKALQRSFSSLDEFEKFQRQLMAARMRQ
jgi:hypothetical protein